MNAAAPMLLFLSGWPACGETFYGEWLARRYDFRHIDLDADRSGDAEWLDLWKKLRPRRARAFANHLLKTHPRWVLTGQAPTGDLSRLEALQYAGFSLWFFLAHREGLSRQRWLMLEREIDPGARPIAWEKQARAIRSNARGLRPFFRNQCVETLSGSGDLLDGDELAVRLGLLKSLSPHRTA